MPCAAHDLGYLYAKGLGVPKNYKIAMDYFRRAAQPKRIYLGEGFSVYSRPQAKAYANYMVKKIRKRPLNLTKAQLKKSQEIERTFVKLCWQ